MCLQWTHPSVPEEEMQLEASVGIDKTTTDSWSNAAVVAQYFHVEIVRLQMSLVRCSKTTELMGHSLAGRGLTNLADGAHSLLMLRVSPIILQGPKA